ncbi:septation protein SepH [Corynebacterium doosanense]|uniref:DUF3071 domain-containing protein n=1 Tax=Corynebacterium doosanense CAU 212 = DSM 45436 TaxID=558173 RepID=A0A097IEG0_9CORY|nr:septation protein SepH [Corynebacterium doosanense]AIT60516.1 hypothetical protein CDOO_04080 [Corynebacterium doosanense CAU 212 = DSM 45436]
MRELKLVNDDSTPTSLVFIDESGEQYFLSVDEDLRSALRPTSPDAGSTPVTIVNESGPTAQEPQPEPAAEVETVAEETPAARQRSLPQPDPLYSAPLSLRPREIQTRIRAGASVEQLAEEMGVAVSRVEVYAHPVLLERSQIAQLARQAHPVREDGPAKLTLAEVLAAAFGARGHSLADATWDAFREPDGEWIIRVTWQAGLSENEAQWVFHRHGATSSTAEPRNAVAADLTDPDFVQPVRSLTSISRGTRYEEAMPAHQLRTDSDRDGELDGTRDAQDARDTAEIDVVPDPPHEAEDDFLQHPESEAGDKPAKRRRKAVTPHWEDVLLGVRTNTKRPKN